MFIGIGMKGSPLPALFLDPGLGGAAKGLAASVGCLSTSGSG